MTDQIYQLAETVGKELTKRHLVLATAESCTGGGLSYWITSVPGSSKWFDCGFVTYSNAAKHNILDVKEETLSTAGAVSEQTVRAMAEGALTHSRADVSIAITGIAGPDGGTVEKPVGTVWTAIAFRKRPLETHCHIYPGDRELIRLGVIEFVLQKLLDNLNKPINNVR